MKLYEPISMWIFAGVIAGLIIGGGLGPNETNGYGETGGWVSE